MLVLPIKKKWFDMIKSGEKKEEYREIKKYYFNRLPKYFGGYYDDGIWLMNANSEKEIVFRNGYSKKSPSIRCLCSLRVGRGKEEWRS